MEKEKILKLVYPQWQGGLNRNYATGANVLSYILSNINRCKTIEVPVSFDEIDKKSTDTVYAKDIILKQQYDAMSILKKESPDKIITIGGDCSVSQVPFDYLNGIYQDLAILWFDAHPDITTPKNSKAEHTMVLGNLMGQGEPDFAKTVENPFSVEKILYVGLIADELLPYEQVYLNEYKMSYLTPKELNNSDLLLNWLRENKIKNIAIHFDLDVLTPNNFRSLLCNNPSVEKVDYSIGKLTLQSVVQLMRDASSVSNLVGFTISEYMPWDIINLQSELSKLDIFNS